MSVDRDFIEFKRGMGKWTEDQKLLWDFLTEIMDVMIEIKERLPEKEEEEEEELEAQFKIQPQSITAPSTPPVKKDFTSRLSPN